MIRISSIGLHQNGLASSSSGLHMHEGWPGLWKYQHVQRMETDQGKDQMRDHHMEMCKKVHSWPVVMADFLVEHFGKEHLKVD
eukprot:3072802-Karenia_brevis.AAC.1